MAWLRTDHGEIHHGSSLAVMETLPDASVDLVVTSPPYALTTRKPYDNVHASVYVDWFRPFARQIHRVLSDTGSLALVIGGTWNAGEPTRSLYHFRVLIDLCDTVGFHLAQEFYWWSPSKMPGGAQWVTVQRKRVKDAVEPIWWLGKTRYAKANNRAVLWPYSESYKKRAATGKGINRQRTPSGHPLILRRRYRDNGGAIPPNLLAIAHTDSHSQYHQYCRAQHIEAHPARFPATLPEFFVRLCTDEGDTVLDPFAGSCVTGEVCERLRRRWICVETDEDYLRGARGRFDGGVEPARKTAKRYEIPHPAATWTADADASGSPVRCGHAAVGHAAAGSRERP